MPTRIDYDYHLEPIAKQAEDLATFAAYPSTAPSQRAIIQQIQELNQKIARFVSYRQPPSQEPSSQEPSSQEPPSRDVTVLSGLKEQLDNAVQNPNSWQELTETFRSISDIARGWITPPSPLVPFFAPPPSPAFPQSDFSFLPENFEEPPVELSEDNSQAKEDRNANLFHSHAQELRAVDELLMHLKDDELWSDAFEYSSPELFEVFPGLLEGYLLWKSTSYQEYCASNPDAEAAITEELYGTIKALSFKELAESFGQALPGKDLSSSMLVLKSLGVEKRLQNDGLLELGLERQDKVLRQQELANQITTMSSPELLEELTKAMSRSKDIIESVVFIEAALLHRMNDIDAKNLNELVVWLSGRGWDLLLQEILNQKANEISLDTYFRAFDRANRWDHPAIVQRLFDNYPHNTLNAPQKLLHNLAIRGVGRGVEMVLAPNYIHHFNQEIIDEVFAAASGRTPVLQYFFNASIVPSEGVLDEVFKEFCEQSSFSSLEPFLQPSIIERIPNAGDYLNDAINSLIENAAEEDNEETFWESIDFFLKPEISQYLGPLAAMSIASKVLKDEDIAMEEKLKIFHTFTASPLFPRLTSENLNDLIIDAMHLQENSEIADLLMLQLDLDRRFESLLFRSAIRQSWDVLSRLLQMDSPISTSTLVGMLLQIASHAPLAIVQQIFDRAPLGFPPAVITSALNEATRNNNDQTREYLQQRVRERQQPTEKEQPPHKRSRRGE